MANMHEIQICDRNHTLPVKAGLCDKVCDKDITRDKKSRNSHENFFGLSVRQCVCSVTSLCNKEVRTVEATYSTHVAIRAQV